MRKAIVIAAVTWALVMTAMAARAYSAPATYDVQLRSYHDGWGVVTSVPTLGQEPTTFVFTTTVGPLEYNWLGPYVERIQWGAGPGGAPLVSVMHDTGASGGK